MFLNIQMFALSLLNAMLSLNRLRTCIEKIKVKILKDHTGVSNQEYQIMQNLLLQM